MDLGKKNEVFIVRLEVLTMAKGKMSPKQKEILEYIKSQILDRGFPPAVRDLCEAVHLRFTLILRHWRRMVI